jgi:hypothetical protein
MEFFYEVGKKIKPLDLPCQGQLEKYVTDDCPAEVVLIQIS